MADHGEASKDAAATTAAAELLMEEMARERTQRKLADAKVVKKEVVLEKVSVTTDAGIGASAQGNEMMARQRALQDKLAKKEMEIKSQGERLSKLSAELKALEEPMKMKIMEVRTRLEEINREESGLVSEVNAMRIQLDGSEAKLKVVRETKQTATDDLVAVMATFEKRKMERLQEISELVGDRSLVEDCKGNAPKAKTPNFGGF